MKKNKDKSKFSSALNYFIKKTAIGSLVGVVMLSSTVMITPDLVAQASTNNGNEVAYEQVATAVSNQPFKDVKVDNYAYDAIMWGKSKGLISGYTDAKGNPTGKFGPNDTVTEAQFVKMLSVYLGLKDTNGDITKNKSSKAHWSDTYYDSMGKHGAPLNGYFDNTIRNIPMKRGSVAQVLGYLLEDKMNLNDSINFLLGNGITTGQNPQFEGKDLNKYFGSTNSLTRGQAITFIYRVDTKKLNNLGSIADGTGSPHYDMNLNDKAKEGSTYVDSILGGNNNNNNNDGKYDDFFGDENDKEIPNNPVEDVSAAALIKELKNIVGSSNIELLEKSGYKPTMIDSNADKKGTSLVMYTKKTSTTYVSYTFNFKDGVLTFAGSSYASFDLTRTIMSNILGISKSSVTGTVKDNKITHKNFTISVTSEGIISLVRK